MNIVGNLSKVRYLGGSEHDEMLEVGQIYTTSMNPFVFDDNRIGGQYEGSLIWLLEIGGKVLFLSRCFELLKKEEE